MNVKSVLKRVRHVSHIDPQIVEHITSLYLSNTIDRTLKELGSGTYGAVYEYEGYAVKVFLNNYGFHRRSKDYLRLEKIHQHECFPTLYCYLPDHFMIMEKIDGLSFAELEYGYGKIHPIENWKDIIQDGYRYALEQKVIPDDVHFENVMLNKDGIPKIIDFGCFIKARKNTIINHKKQEKYLSSLLHHLKINA